MCARRSIREICIEGIEGVELAGGARQDRGPSAKRGKTMTLQWRAQLKRALIRSIMCLYAAAPVCGSGVEEPSRQQKIIVSLTSYPKRFRYLHLTVKSLLLQTVKPDKIILYLGDDARDVPLPEALVRLKKKGLSIEYRTGNLRSHKKYVYAMQEYPDDLVITVDDDMLYEPQLVARLLASYARYPNAVSARRVHRMAKKTDGTIAAYNDWEYECKTIVKPQMDLFPTTGSGVLFPAHCMDACAGSRTLYARMRCRRRCMAEVYAAQKRDADGICAGTAIFGAAGHADYEFERRKCRCLQKRCVYSKSANGAGSAAWRFLHACL